MESTAAYQLAIATVLILFIIYRYSRGQDGAGLPPGPKPIPILGNLFDLPPPDKPAHEHWIKFKEKYGSISSIKLLGTTIVILHDHDATHELLTKHSTKTSNRPPQVFANELCGYGVLLSNKIYGDIYKHQRKLVHQQLGTKKLARQFYEAQDVESRRLLYRVLNEPDSLMKHIKTLSSHLIIMLRPKLLTCYASEASAIMLKMTYGYSVAPHTDDPLVTMMEHMMDNFSRAMIPVGWMVDIFPSLQYLPHWFPGASYKRIARGWKQNLDMTMDVPYRFVKKQMLQGKYDASYASSLISQCSVGNVEGKPTLSKEDEETIKSTACIMYGGGADTTVSTIAAFLLAMILFPEVQQKAQQEVDSVVGIGKLPHFDHQERLPYVNALVKEALRWFPVTPIGTTHVTQEELTVAGYRIPKGSYLLPSIWWFLHDPNVHPNPFNFEPERFLAPRNEPEPETNVFGYGRRICPGRYLADDNLFLTISRLLATFEISKAVDAENKEIVPELGGIPGLINHPGYFPYQIRPRGKEQVDLIRSVVIEHPWNEGDSQSLNELGVMIGNIETK